MNDQTSLKPTQIKRKIDQLVKKETMQIKLSKELKKLKEDISMLRKELNNAFHPITTYSHREEGVKK